MSGELDALLNRFLDMGIPAFDCLVYYRGREGYRRSAGYADYARTVPLDASHRFNLYSATKLITVTAVMRLVEQGVLHLQDRLSDFFPEFARMKVRTGDTLRDAQTPITIEHLLTMTAGLNYDRSPSRPIWMEARALSGGTCPTVQTVRLLAKEPLDFEPGTNWAYSFAHDLLGAVVETICGESFSIHADRRIFRPLGMTHSSFSSSDLPDALLCAQYRYNPQTIRMDNCGTAIQNGFRLGPSYEAGGAGCCSTAEDMMKLLESLRKGEILQPDTVSMMATNHLHGGMVSVFQQDQQDHRYGYGLGVGCPNGTDGWDCFGWGGAAGAFCAVDRKHEMSIVFLEHVLDRPNRLERRELYTAAKKDLVNL